MAKKKPVKAKGGPKPPTSKIKGISLKGNKGGY